MTRARALKAIIRSRAAKTGERYTTARRHVLKELQPRPAAVVRFAPKPAPAAPASSKGGLSDAKSRERTGHGLDHWFEVLDRFGGTAKGHTACARHLYADHNVDGWYAQGITVAFERARGARAVNQRCDGEYEVAVSKVLTTTTTDLIAGLTNKTTRGKWARDVDPALTKALGRALDHPTSKGFVVRPDGQGRFRYKWGSTTVQLYTLPKPRGKVSLVATNSKLGDGGMVEERRAQWRAALNALARWMTMTNQLSRSHS
jgi:hypothetical protein